MEETSTANSTESLNWGAPSWPSYDFNLSASLHSSSWPSNSYLGVLPIDLRQLVASFVPRPVTALSELAFSRALCVVAENGSRIHCQQTFLSAQITHIDGKIHLCIAKHINTPKVIETHHWLGKIVYKDGVRVVWSYDNIIQNLLQHTGVGSAHTSETPQRLYCAKLGNDQRGVAFRLCALGPVQMYLIDFLLLTCAENQCAL